MMKCEVCGTSLGNSKVGKEAHLKKFHGISTTVTQSKTVYSPPADVDVKRVAKEFEAKHAKAFMLDSVEQTSDTAKNMFEDLPTTDFGFKEPVKEAKKMTEAEFHTRLDALVERSEATLKLFKERFGE